MAFSTTQARQLKAKLSADHVKSRTENGATLNYIEGWHAISEANRIFGYDAWDRQTLSSRCVWTGSRGRYYMASYTTKVRISVRAGDIVIMREGSGSGESKALTPGQAHEIALKSAETDATKRALATFGNPFGLALYDPAHTGVRPTKKDIEEAPCAWALRSANGRPTAEFHSPNDFAKALNEAMCLAPDIESLFELWGYNLDSVRALNKETRQPNQQQSATTADLVGHLKKCAVALAAPENKGTDADEKHTPDCGRAPAPKHANGARQQVDKSVLTISEPKRIRSKEHLKFVASQPCVVCGRKPCHAHHVRHAQSRGMSLKVSDEFTVPLCAIHHNDVHRFGTEETWWRERNLDPLGIARSLWEESQGTRAKREGPNGSAESPLDANRSKIESEGSQANKV